MNLKSSNISKNQKYGRWLVIGDSPITKNNSIKILCRCECGKIKEIYTQDLLRGKSKSCGCLQKEIVSETNSTHKMSKTRIYKIWIKMRERCQNQNNKDFKYYGGRGIKVCSEWITFEPFYKWAISRGYKSNLTIERTDNEGNYEPNNCEWIKLKGQALNRRSNTIITHNGRSLHAIEWSRLLGIPAPTISYRLSQGYPPGLILKQGRLNSN